MTDRILYRKIKSVKAGQIERFELDYHPDRVKEPITKNIWVKVKNIEPIAMRAAFITGPYLLYVDCRSEEYKQDEKCFITANQPSFEPQLQPGKSFIVELSCNTIKDHYKWTIDVISQMIFSSALVINFEIVVGTSKDIINEEIDVQAGDLTVNNLDTFDIWNLPVPQEKPIHLVILTHGLHSNVSADMLYLKEAIDSFQNNDNVVVKGFFGNICKTERGIKYLGSRVAEFIIDLVVNDSHFNEGKVSKISFIGHSLGGLVQTFTIAYLQNNFAWFFKTITPVNFITIASPLLGASNENPIYINLALSAGIVGITGQDLSLRFQQHDSKPLLLLLPSGPTHKVLKQFQRRTVYANVANDGVVPLRTSALLFLDHKGLSSIMSREDMDCHHLDNSTVDKIPEEKNNGYQSMLPQPVQMILAKLMPQKQVKEPEGEIDESRFLKQIKGLHKSNVIETVQSLILPPLPPMKYIVNPEERDNVIVYEKIYSEADLPAFEPDDKTEGDSLSKRILSSIDLQEFENIEEQIAREYHKGMEWKKVLVRLKPDAHNNIIVRRRFSNAYGWPVIKHLVESHFSDEEIKSGFYKFGVGIDQTDSLEEIGLSGILSRELIRRENQNIDKKEDDHQWINTKDESFFPVGPAGLLADVGEMVVNLRNQWWSENVVIEKEISDKDLINEYEMKQDFI
ncbi:putative lipase Rog1p [[Candida] jaroonii]|uniref:Lipase Rog1p n=1 Tax=[Candida] jaroonii TaxID=467808 RepID=A0ACA9Y184_9ASCO|nr:putative lipase Rog1p [[Candida] jaroonii]